MTRHKKQRNANGHAGSHGRINGDGGRKTVNGHAPASTGRGGIPAHRDRAASDDASGASVASAASSASAAGTDRHAYAEAAPSRAKEKNGSSRRGNGRSGKAKADEVDAFHMLGSTDVAAIQDGSAYFDAVAARVDLVGASVRLIIAKDHKTSKSELDRLREMKFGKIGAAVVEEPPQLDFTDWPRRGR